MSDGAARLLALAFIAGWDMARADTPWSGRPQAQAVVDFLFNQHKTVVTLDWVNELVKEYQSGL